MIYGYTRISKSNQVIDRQIRNILKEYPTAHIIQEVFTRTTLNRKEWNKLFNKVKSGDTIVFDSVSRMSGESDEGFNAYEILYNRGVNLVFLKEPHINTDVYKKALETNIQLTGNSVDYILEGVNKYLMVLAKEQIKLAFIQSQKEVDDLHQRVKEGMETARLNGKTLGKPKGTGKTTKKSKEMKDIILKHSADFNGNLNDIEMMKLTALSRNTYYKYKRELKEELKGV
jgi:DNA invertase Pin-like site-specific DNA recombinase